VEVAHLEELPGHRQLEQRADAPGHDHEGVGEQREVVVEPREERPVLVGASHEGIHLLLEGQGDADPDRPLPLLHVRRGRAFVGSLHQAGAPAGHDVAAHSRERSREPYDLIVGRRALLDPGGAEDRDPVVRALRTAQARELADDLPQALHRRLDQRGGVVLVADQDGVGRAEAGRGAAHRPRDVGQGGDALKSPLLQVAALHHREFQPGADARPEQRAGVRAQRQAESAATPHKPAATQVNPQRARGAAERHIAGRARRAAERRGAGAHRHPALHRTDPLTGGAIHDSRLPLDRSAALAGGRQRTRRSGLRRRRPRRGRPARPLLSRHLAPAGFRSPVALAFFPQRSARIGIRWRGQIPPALERTMEVAMTLQGVRFGAGALLFGCALVLAAQSARADEAAELRQLREEIAAERAALAKERQAVADQRVRVDDTLRQMKEAEAERARSAGTGTLLPGVGAEQPAPRLEVYGFIQTDMIYDADRIDPDWSPTLRVSKIPVNCPGDAGCGSDGETILSVRQSRLGFKGFIPTDIGELKTIFEFDLYGVGDDAGETTVRFRHIWAELGEFGAGQTNSLFMDGDIFPNTIDYWGPTGMVFLRNPQVRWTPAWFGDQTKWAIALESPGSGIDQGKIDQIDPTFDASAWNRYPDVTSQLRHSGDFGHVQLAGIVRSLGYEATSERGEDKGRELGWGVNLTSALDMGMLSEATADDQLLLGIVYGEGISNYMNDGGTDLAPDRSPPGAKAETVPTLGWMVYYNRTWNEQWTSSIGYSEHRQDTTRGQDDDAFEVGQYASVNLLYHPIPQMFVGPELLWGRRENQNGDEGSDTRVQLSFHYNFGGTIYGGER
jgi:hypothetical protein